MYAIFKGTKFVMENCNLDYIDSLIIVSDSNLCISSLSIWMPGWIKNSKNEILINSTGQPVANQELIKSTFINILILNNGKYQFYIM